MEEEGVTGKLRYILGAVEEDPGGRVEYRIDQGNLETQAGAWDMHQDTPLVD